MASHPQEQITQLHSSLAKLSSDEIHALQAFGIQQAGRNGLGRDSRIFVIFGVVGLVLGLVSPVYLFVKVIQVIVSVILIGAAAKAYNRPEIRDMIVLVALLGISTVWNVIAGIALFIAMLTPVFTIFFFVLAGVEGRWALSLWQAYRVANNSSKDFDNTYQHIVSLYHQLTEVLGASEPHLDNPLLYFKTGKNSLRIFLSEKLALLLYRSGMMQVVPAQNLALRPADDSDMEKLNFDAEMMVNKKVMRGEVSQLSYDTFLAWRDSQS